MSSYPVTVALLAAAIGFGAVDRDPPPRNFTVAGPCAALRDSRGAPRFWDADDPANHEGIAQMLGQVLTPDEQPYPGVYVTLEAEAPDTLRRISRTDSAGVFKFHQLPPGDYQLKVRLLGFLRQVHEVQLFGGATDTICVRLRYARRSLPPVGLP